MLFMPTAAYAAPGTFIDLVDFLIRHMNAAVVFLISATVILYLFRTARDLFAMGKGKVEDNVVKMRNALLEGLLIIFVMVSIWGILSILANTLNLG
jgi:hypothetical protein